MSKIRLLSNTMPELLPMTDRSPGIHVSDVIRDLCLQLGHFKVKDGNVLDPAWAELGSALEYAIVQRFDLEYPGRYVQPGELERDGLYGTPDLVNVDDWSIEEIKLAWMSSNHAPDSDKFWRYWVQVKAYCWMIESEIGRLHVCHVNGDYRSPGPVYRAWEQRFTEAELAENWAMLLTRAERMSDERKR